MDSMAPPYPMFLNLVQRPVLVVGGGAVGLRKVRSLLESAARITVVSPTLHEGFAALQDVEFLQAAYAATHMARKPWRLVFAATNSREVNMLVQRHAEAAGILCCRCDELEEGDFCAGATQRLGTNRKGEGRGVRAVADRGGVTLVISTTGASPALAARIAREAAKSIDPVLPRLANLLTEWRARTKQEVKDPALRRLLLQRLSGEEMEATLRERGETAALQLFEQWKTAILKGELQPRAAAADRREEGARTGRITPPPPPASASPAPEARSRSSRAAEHVDQ